MRNPTPVTTRTMREDKGSTCKPASDLKEPDSIQLNNCFSKRRASGGRRRSPMNTSIEINKMNATRLSILRPNPTMSEPKKFYFFKSVPLKKGGSRGLCFCLHENYSQFPSSPFTEGDFYASCHPKTRLNENPYNQVSV